MRMIQLRDHSRLTFEELLPLGILCEILRQHLESHQSIQASVSRFVHLAHAAGAQPTEDLVMANPLSDQRRV